MCKFYSTTKGGKAVKSPTLCLCYRQCRVKRPEAGSAKVGLEQDICPSNMQRLMVSIAWGEMASIAEEPVR
eukprot:502947-Hanusia_phi.AAC.1